MLTATTPYGGARPLRPSRHDQDRRRTRPGRRPVRRRFRRRDAADRRPVHERHRAPRQRPRHAAGLPGGDPGSRRYGPRGLGVPDPVRFDRHHDPGRSCRRPGRDEPRRAQGRPSQGRPRWFADPQRGRVHAAQPREGRLHAGPDRRREPRRLPGLQGPDDHDHGSGRRGPRDLQEGGRAREEHVRAGVGLVDVRQADRGLRCSGSRRSSAPSRRSSKPTSRRSTPGTTSARRPRSSARCS